MRTTDERPTPPGSFHFFAGVVLTALAVGVVAIGVVLKFGLPWPVDRPDAGAEFFFPEGVYADLVKAGAVGEGVIGDRLPSTPHNTFFVQPDDELGYRLRPNVRAEVAVIPTKGLENFESSMIQAPAGAQLSEATRSFIASSEAFHIAYTTDAEGRRQTTPPTTARDKVLLVGDSVVFGYGVNDEVTAASQLQGLLGPATQVVNAGVAGYDGDQVVRVADRLSAARDYSTLVYVACQNDFSTDDDDATIASVTRVMAGLKQLAGRFERGVVVVLTTYVDYAARDVLSGEVFDTAARGWGDMLRRRLEREAVASGFRFVDFSAVIDRHRQRERSMLAPFALYVDRSHLSNEGNRLLAAELAKVMATR
jgi:lysophospholipase L1-like esterase